MRDVWYYAGEDNKPTGPFPLAELKAVIVRLPNWRDVLVWRDGDADWRRAIDVAELAPVPPPLPKPPRLTAPPAPTPTPTPPTTPTTPASALAPSATFQELDGQTNPVPAAEQEGSSAKKVLTWIALIIAALVGAVIGKAVVKEFFRTSSNSSSSYSSAAPAVQKQPTEAALSAALRQGLVQVQATLPNRVDEITVLTSARVEGTTMIYSFKLDGDRAEFPDDFQTEMKKVVAEPGCKSTVFRNALNLGASFRYEYVDKKGLPLPPFTVTKWDCR